MVIGKGAPHIIVESSIQVELTELKKLFATAVSVLFSKTDNTEIVIGTGNFITNQTIGGSQTEPDISLAGSNAIRLTSIDTNFTTFVSAAKQYGVSAFLVNGGSAFLLLPGTFTFTTITT